MRPGIITALLLLAASSAILSGCNRPAPQGLKVSGTVEATIAELSFKVGGRLQERLLDEGERVVVGQTVARLDEIELNQERDARLADLRSAESVVADLQAGSRREEIARGEASLLRMRADAGRAATDFGRADELFSRGVISRMEYDAALAQRDTSAAAVTEAEEQVKLLRAGPRPDALRQARTRVDAARAALALSETRASQAVLNSPLSGLVLAKHAEPGEMVAAGAPILTVGKMDEVWIKAYIPETELGRVKVGQKARVTTDTWPGKQYEGKVTFISPQAEFTPKNVQTEKERVKLVYRIKVTLPNPQMELKPGMPADAVIDTGAEPK